MRKLAYLVLVVALCACGGKRGARRGDSDTNTKAPPPAEMGKATVMGKVLETMDSGGYTYLRIEWTGRERWVAVPQSQVKVGDVVTIRDAVEMKTFTSKTLNRTFERILFGQLAAGPASAPAGTGQLPPGHPPVPTSGPAPAEPQHPPLAPPAKVADLKVPKAQGGYTVAGLFAESKKLKDKPVVVNGVVVKINTGIMNKNWVHLADGTGTADKHDNDLVVTTNDTVKVGDKVKVSGTVRTAKDFGFGYRYETLVEDAKLEPLK